MDRGAVGAEVLVTDDADAFKQVADEVGLKHQVCKSHVKRNTEALVEALKPLAMQDADGSLAEICVSPEADLERLRELVARRPVDGEKELEVLHQRYIRTPEERGDGIGGLCCFWTAGICGNGWYCTGNGGG